MVSITELVSITNELSGASYKIELSAFKVIPPIVSKESFRKEPKMFKITTEKVKGEHNSVVFL